MKKIAVVGTGAVGSLIGGYLTRAGEDVTLIDPWFEHIKAMRERGLKIDGCRGEHLIQVKALHTDELTRLTGKQDIIFLAVKSNDTKIVLNNVFPYLNDDGCVVSFQNGINTDVISGIVGTSRTIGCAIRFSVLMWEAGHVTQTGEPEAGITIGEINGEITQRVQEIAHIMSQCVPSKVTANIMGQLWSKLALNCMANSMSGLTGYNMVQLCNDERMRYILSIICAEVIQVAEALRYKIEPPILGVNNELWKRSRQTRVNEVEEAMLEQSRKRSDNYPSLLQDIIKGRATEVDYLNGFVVSRGREVSIPTPANEVIQHLVKEVENGKLKSSPENIGIAHELIAETLSASSS